jgi:hypothetical protein
MDAKVTKQYNTKMDEIDYDKDVQIDPDALDIEWLSQSALMMRYAKAAAEARRQVDLAKERLDIVKADLDRKIRSNPEEFGIVKPTESGVANTILLQPAYMAASKEFIDAKYEAEMTRGAVGAIDSRKNALENLVRLFGQLYFAGPKGPRDLSREWQEEQQRRVDSKVIMTRRNPPRG